ncbi:uncharacterized protein Z520_09393 [Fonsecaea multimorphosa CBS 102226]|uniref:Uncharacterized protein n=1 Tax=Fonsecaea multimorphosa CBS 102226 TaxID=1442371 RepID=A0A0D2KDB1_9EURO|nr:uncharacterized protein Z520_09393 [Fonsecaea multimorphosa CBS 102226]KIX94703.1 hypothetical protein Z520_09393 [Fonsecaea multimorphosa CBS 102226]OAL20478.1 hypothetical protein AYO22_08779 [Fonsecaea multimorphosa]
MASQDPGLLARFNHIVQGAVPTYTYTTGSVQRVRVIGIPGFIYPSTTDSDEERLAFARTQIETAFTNPDMLKAVFNTADSGRLTIFMTGENALCGQTMADGTTWEFPGKNTVPLSWQPAIRETLLDCAQYIAMYTHETIGCSMTTTYDLGVNDANGKPTLSNTSILVCSENNEAWSVDKGIPSQIDGYDNWVMVDTTGSAQTTKVFSVSDILGGGATDSKSVMLSIRICLDATQDTPFDQATELRPPDIVLCPALGAPARESWSNGLSSVVMVADTADQHITQVMKGGTGTWQKVDNFAPLSHYSYIDTQQATQASQILGENLLQAHGFAQGALLAETFTRVPGSQVITMKDEETGATTSVIETATASIPTRPEMPATVASLNSLMGGTSSVIDAEGFADGVWADDPDTGLPPEEPVDPASKANDQNLALTLTSGLGATEAKILKERSPALQRRKQRLHYQPVQHYVLGSSGIASLSKEEKDELSQQFRTGPCTVSVLTPADAKTLTDVEALIGTRRLSSAPAETISRVSYYHYVKPPNRFYEDRNVKPYKGTVIYTDRCNTTDAASEEAKLRTERDRLHRWLLHFNYGWHPLSKHSKRAFDTSTTPQVIPLYYRDAPEAQVKGTAQVQGTVQADDDTPTDLMNIVSQFSDLWPDIAPMGQLIDITNPNSNQNGIRFGKIAVTTIGFGVTWTPASISTNVKDIYYVSHAVELAPNPQLTMGGYVLRTSIIDPAAPDPYICTANDIYPAMVESSTGFSGTDQDFLAVMDLNERFFCYPGLQVRNIFNGPRTFIVQSSSPQTTQETTQLTTGVDYSVTGNWGFFDASGTGSISGSASFSSSKTTEVPAVKVTDMSSMYGFVQDAMYRFDFSSNTLVGATTIDLQTEQLFFVDDDLKGDRTTGTGITQKFQLIVYGWAYGGNNQMYTWREIRPFELAVPPLPAGVNPPPPPPPIPPTV